MTPYVVSTDGYIARGGLELSAWSLVDLAVYCAETFPSELAWSRMPVHVMRLASRRVREGRTMGWLSGSPSRPPAFL